MRAGDGCIFSAVYFYTRSWGANRTNHMKPKNKVPVTRTEADAPNAMAHLTPSQVEALEISDEAEHSTGPQRERLTKKAAKLGQNKTAGS